MQCDDPYLWLEDIEGEAAIKWVKERNDRTLSSISGQPEFDLLNQKIMKIFNSDDRIPRVRKAGKYYYNFWQDAKNPKGIWRRTLVTDFFCQDPRWEVVLDFDQLSREEQANWSYQYASFRKPDFNRCLIYLACGGTDSAEIREFDLLSKSFVPDGFRLGPSKGAIEWLDEDRVLVAIDFGPDSSTKSGYPRLVKEWKRGTRIESAETVFEVPEDYVSAAAAVDRFGGYERQIFYALKSRYDKEYYLRQPGGSLLRLPVAGASSVLFFGAHLILSLWDDWFVGGKKYLAGAVLACDVEALFSGNFEWQELFCPSHRRAVQQVGRTKDYVFLHVTDNLKNELVCFHTRGSTWCQSRYPYLPEIGTIEIQVVDENEGNEIFVLANDFLKPDTLLYGAVTTKLNPVKSLPDQFDASRFRTEQLSATSLDGTSIPYFVVMRRDTALDSRNPTLLYGYGGFQISLLPSYDGSRGCGWLDDGGVYVVANIRGGGEFGPRWHRAALRENRHKCYEDFEAVACDLIARGITSPPRLGIHGGSNGGLLVANMLVRRPELFGAVVCSVPLLDMKRYHKLLAGASWMAEYGNPDDPDDWGFMQHFSPYHLAKSEVKYPPTLFITSTKDDRVHPCHARKMMARLEEFGHDVWYYESIEGGHAGAVTPEQKAFMRTIIFQFLKNKIMVR